MNKNRLEAFSDGVLAIIITIMVLEIKVPEESNLNGLLHIAPTLIGYLLSFVFVGIYWNNHHHLLHTLKKVNPEIMWSNLNLLFWLSLVPFATKWMGESHFNEFPVIVYAVVLILCGASFMFLSNAILKTLDNENLKKVLKFSLKDLSSILFYVLAILLAHLNTYYSISCFAIVSIIWILPNKKIEKELNGLK